MHVLPGILLTFGAFLHLWLHWDWIKAAIQNYSKLPAQARQNAWIDLALFSTYTLCGFLGLTARLVLFISPILHIFIGLLHALLGVLVIVIQTVHLARHYKWITANLQKALQGDVLRPGR